MSRVNWLLTLLSLNAILVIIERLSPTTKILLQPYNYLRVHEVFQMLVVILLSIVISFYLLKTLSNNFELLKTHYGTFLGVLFSLGIYLTATGNGAHEIASFAYNTFCNTQVIGYGNCASSYINDYYFGNIVYFAGLLLGNISLILFEIKNPQKNTTKNQTIITLANGLFYALALIAYAAPDPVSVGLWFVIISAVVVNFLLLRAKKKFTLLPFTLYCSIAYTFASIVTLILRLR